jgi:predicted ester cyclase
MSANRIAEFVESFYRDIWNRNDKARIETLLRPDFKFRGSLGQLRTGHQGFLTYVDFVNEALADFRCDILDLVIEEPKAFARMRFSGIHRGELFGYSPTGKPVEWSGAALFTFLGDQVAELWVLGDVHGLLQLLDQNAHG